MCDGLCRWTAHWGGTQPREGAQVTPHPAAGREQWEVVTISLPNWEHQADKSQVAVGGLEPRHAWHGSGGGNTHTHTPSSRAGLGVQRVGST